MSKIRIERTRTVTVENREYVVPTGIYLHRTTAWQVRRNGVQKVFFFSTYGSCDVALDNALTYRNSLFQDINEEVRHIKEDVSLLQKDRQKSFARIATIDNQQYEMPSGLSRLSSIDTWRVRIENSKMGRIEKTFPDKKYFGIKNSYKIALEYLQQHRHHQEWIQQQVSVRKRKSGDTFKVWVAAKNPIIGNPAVLVYVGLEEYVTDKKLEDAKSLLLKKLALASET